MIHLSVENGTCRVRLTVDETGLHGLRRLMDEAVVNGAAGAELTVDGGFRLIIAAPTVTAENAKPTQPPPRPPKPPAADPGPPAPVDRSKLPIARPCPRCGAQAGEACLDTRSLLKRKPIATVHPDR